VIVCPQCRNANEEDANFCARCGRSLEPGPSALAARREVDRPAEAELDLPPPKPRSRVPVLVFLGVIALGVLGWWAYSATRPNPCEGRNFVSERFGYCLVVPEGWRAGPASIGLVGADEIGLPQEASTVIIYAVDLAANVDLDDYADRVRQTDADDGLDPGPMRDLFIDEARAVQWDSTVETDTGDQFVLRHVVAIRDETAWVISLSDVSGRLRAHEKPFQRMLSSFAFTQD
jgi:hypothetical protein